MKHVTLLLVGLLMCSYAISRDFQDVKEPRPFRTIFNSELGNGWYGAFSMGYTSINHTDAVLIGGRGAWIVNPSLAIGMGGQAFINNIDTNSSNAQLTGGYGGLILEPIIAPNQPIHLSLPILIGAGSIACTESYWTDWYYNNGEEESFFVFEPGVELELNMTSYFRLAASVSYRLTSNIDMTEASTDALRGFNVGLVFKFGKF